MTDTQKTMLSNWLLRLKIIYRAYYASAVATDRAHYVIGISAVILSVLPAAQFFVITGVAKTEIGAAILALITLVVSCLALIQTFLKLPEKAERYRSAGVHFSDLHREIEHLMVRSDLDVNAVDQQIISIRKKWEDLGNASPTAINRIFEALVKKHLPQDISVPK